MINEWDLTATNLGRLQKRKYEVAVLPTSAHEAHNFHLPEGQDFLHTSYVARTCCQRAFERTGSVICLPGLPFGVDCNLMDFPLSIHVSQAVLDAMIGDIVLSLRHHGIRKVVLVNGHGGNDFIPLIRQLHGDTDSHVFLCNWWTLGADQYPKIFDKPDDHAGMMETSVALALFPELVDSGPRGDGKPRPFKFEALQKGWIKTSRVFSRLNDHCAVGDPAGASAEKGRQYLDLVIERVTDFLVELAEAEIDDVFPHAG